MPQRNKKTLVSIIMGSQSDYSTMKYTEVTLKYLKIRFETKIISAHRTPKRLFEFAKKSIEIDSKTNDKSHISS